MNTTRVLYMPIPMQLAGMPFLGKDGQPILDPGSKYGSGFVPSNPLGPMAGQYYGARDLTDEINPAVNLRQTDPFGWQTINKDNIGASFQNLLNEATSNPARFTPGYRPYTSGHHQTADQLLGIFNKGGPSIGLEDETGTVQLTPGGLNLQSTKGWSAGFNPMGGNINVGPVGIQGTWAGDKSIQATFNLGAPKEQRMGNMMMNIMKPVNIYGPGGNVTYEVQSPLNEAQKLKEQMLYEYEQKNPYYYRP